MLKLPGNPKEGDVLEYFYTEVSHECENILSGFNLVKPERRIARYTKNDSKLTSPFSKDFIWVDRGCTIDIYRSFNSWDDAVNDYKGNIAAYKEELRAYENRIETIKMDIGD